ncbi:MAG: AraC family transcriptional regulator [Treponema sp.]|nr:AraC family transcriptional regulator [Treponema sp.]
MDYMSHYEKSPSLRSHGLHAHDYFEIYLHINGGRQYCVDDTVFELKQNQIIIIPPLHMHGLVCDKDLIDYERCYLYITPETLKKCGFNKIDLCSLFEDSCNNKKFSCEISSDEGCKIINHLKKIEENSSAENNEFVLEDYSLILDILNIVQKNYISNSKITNQITVNSGMYKVLHFINEHFTENISINQLSNLFNMSESALSHEFRKYSNKSVYDYILYKRIIKAKELLLSDLSLTQIALECGFNDYSNFLRVFKKFSNCSPKEYKKKLL